MINIYCIFLFFLYINNSTPIDNLEKEPLASFFYKSDYEIIRNAKMNVGSIDFNYNNPRNYHKETRKELLDLFLSVEYNPPLFPVKIYVSLSVFERTAQKISEDEIEKIIKFIIDCKENDRNILETNNGYRLDVVKIHKRRRIKDLFDLLPEFDSLSHYNSKKIATCFYHFFIFEDITKNKQLKISIRSKLNQFFKNYGIKSIEQAKTSVSIIAVYRCLNVNFLKKLCMKINRLEKTTSCLTKIGFTCVEFQATHDYYTIYINYIFCFKNYWKELFLKSKINKRTISKTIFDISNNKENVYLKNLIRFSSSQIFFEIRKVDCEIDAGDKLFNFLGYGPILNRFCICFKTMSNNIVNKEYDILVILEQIESFTSINDKNQTKIFSKKIIISEKIDFKLCELFSCTYIIKEKYLVGFPLTFKEREIVEELAENNDIGAKNLLNFINIYESFILCKGNFYFHSFYKNKLSFIEKINFYQREINFYELSQAEINILISNSLKFASNQKKISKTSFLNNFKEIEVYGYETIIFKKFINVEENNTQDILKGLRNHFVDKINLRFYDKIKKINNLDYNDENYFIEYFVKVNLGYNKEYLIFFKKSGYENFENEKLIDMDLVHKKAFEMLLLDFSKVLNIYDIDTQKKYLKGFINIIINIIKYFLFDNIRIEKLLFSELYKKMDSFDPEIQRILMHYSDNPINEASETNIEKMNSNFKNNMFEVFLNKLITIFRNCFLKKRYEVCFLMSLSVEKDESDLILQFLCNDGLFLRYKNL